MIDSDNWVVNYSIDDGKGCGVGRGNLYKGTTDGSQDSVDLFSHHNNTHSAIFCSAGLC